VKPLVRPAESGGDNFLCIPPRLGEQVFHTYRRFGDDAPFDEAMKQLWQKLNENAAFVAPQARAVS